MKIPSFMVADHEPVVLNFEALESACKLSFNKDQRDRLTSAAEAYRAWSKAASSRDGGGLLCSDKALKLHLKKIATKAGELAELLNVDPGTHPREADAVDQLWEAIGLEKPTVEPRQKGLCLPSPPNPETQFFRPRNLAVFLETYSRGAKAFVERMPNGKPGPMQDLDLVHYVKVLRAIFQEAGGGDGKLCYWSEAQGCQGGAFFRLACEWRSQSLGILWEDCVNPVVHAIDKEQESMQQEGRKE
ncbi:hypothetical protein [Desulfomicrobium salsuginis]